MVKVGIDALAFYTPRYQLNLTTLAEARGIDPDKFLVGLGQHAMSIAAPGDDIVTMGANAASKLLENEDVQSIAMVLFATESGIDQSKSAGLYIHELLKLPTTVRVLELKQACYAATGALQLALPFLRENQDKKILLIASDIARYGLGTPGESSQGAGAVAMLLSAHPRVLAIEPEYGVASESVMDFWRPNYSSLAFVDGKYSSKLYLSMLEKSFRAYEAMSHRTYQDHAYFCYHAPVPRLVEKAHQYLFKLTQKQALSEAGCQAEMDHALRYNRQMGNSYTASLYVSLLSLLEYNDRDLSNERIGFYSYGSGCVAEFFSGIVQPGYKNQLHIAHHQSLLANRQILSYEQYEAFFNFAYAEHGESQTIPLYETGHFRLASIQDHKRCYASLENELPIVDRKSTLTIAAPGKLILSGEHAVLYGAPALAIAIDRYVSATISSQAEEVIHFRLTDFAHDSHVSWQALHELKDKIKEKYHRFMRGDYTIRQVLQKPFELAQVALGLLSEKIAPPTLSGMNLTIASTLPIGCGMGSSAATIMSVMKALSHFFHLSLSEEVLFKAALEAENLQHGHSSGFDLRLALHGGCLYMKEGVIQSRPMPAFPFHLIQTGQPVSSTGQCVAATKAHFQTAELVSAFAAVTQAMDVALQQNAIADIQAAVKENHRLLSRIGVIPQKVQSFIQEVEAAGGAAKVCGAGAVDGDAAGALWVVHETPENLMPLLKRYGYQQLIVRGVETGVYAA